MNSTPRTRVRFGSYGLIALLGSLVPGCLTLDVPDRFLVIRRGTDELKAISTDEARLWVREFSDENRGDLEFWSGTLETEFSQNRGYAELEAGPIADGDRREGRFYAYEATVQGVPRRYLCALFVLPGWFWNTIRVVEFVAPKQVFDGHIDGVKRSIGTLGP